MLNNDKRERALECSRNHYRKTHPKARAYTRRAETKTTEQIKSQKREYALNTRYGITTSEYNTKFVNQNGRCAICGKHQSEQEKALGVDHNHMTNKVRDLLCTVCNVRLDVIENAEWMKLAQTYLDKHNADS